jgi:hypothetical protein
VIIYGIVTATTDQLQALSVLSERPLREDVVLDPDGEHVLTALVVLDHRSGEECDPFIRCRALLKVVNSDNEVEQSHLDVDLWQYATYYVPEEIKSVPGLNITLDVPKEEP